MNENSTMLYKHPGNKLKVRVRKNERLVWEIFNTMIVPSDDVESSLEDGWYRTPSEALDPPKESNFLGGNPETPVKPFVEKSETDIDLPGENDPRDVSLEDAIKEIVDIKGQGSKKRLIKHAKEFGIAIEIANFTSMKKLYIGQLKAKYDDMD